MSLYLYKKIYLIIAAFVLLCSAGAYADSNNGYVFNGTTGYASVLDGQPVTSGANQAGYQYFDNPAYSNDSISVEAWVYLMGDNPGVKMPIVYRGFDDGYKTFSMYIQDRIAYFKIGNGTGQVSTTGQAPIPAFSWVYISATYNGQTLKLYYNGSLVQSTNVTLGAGHSSGQGGLYVGQSSEGTFKGVIDEIRIWRIALGANHINGSGGNGNPSEPFPQSLAPYLNGEWSFTEFTYYNGVKALKDYSPFNNHLRLYDIDQIVDDKHLPWFIVNSTGDAPDLNPGDGSADAGNGQVTLRSAIMEANALAGYQMVYFYIPGNAPYIIQPGTSLPAVTQPLSLDATTQNGSSGTPVVQVNGANASLFITGGGSTVQGLAINNPAGYGMNISGSGGNIIKLNKISGVSISSAGNSLNGNEITGSALNGLNITANNNNIGTVSANNIHGNAGFGIALTNANSCLIANNIVASNTAGGISLTGSTSKLTGNTISQNSNFGVSRKFFCQ